MYMHIHIYKSMCLYICIYTVSSESLKKSTCFARPAHARTIAGTLVCDEACESL